MHSLFIVTAGVKDWFNQQAEAMGNDGIAISGLPLSASGAALGTHGWCAVSLSTEQEAQVLALLNANPDKAACVDWTHYDLVTQPTWPQERLVIVGLRLIVQSIK